MAKITELKFWIELTKKVVRDVVKTSGQKTANKSWNQHVVPHEKGWAIKGEGNIRYTDTFRKQSTAITRAKTIARKHKAAVIIHGKDGSIRDRISF